VSPFRTTCLAPIAVLRGIEIAESSRRHAGSSPAFLAVGLIVAEARIAGVREVERIALGEGGRIARGEALLLVRALEVPRLARGRGGGIEGRRRGVSQPTGCAGNRTGRRTIRCAARCRPIGGGPAGGRWRAGPPGPRSPLPGPLTSDLGPPWRGGPGAPD